MQDIGIKNSRENLENMGLKGYNKIYWNLSPAELTEHTLFRNEGVLSDTGALVVDTGKFTGRAPQDRFIVKDDKTKDTVNWGNVNIPFQPEKFDELYNSVMEYFENKDVYVRDAYACADDDYRLNIRVVTEYPWQNLFANNLFLRPSQKEIESAEPHWTVVAAPGFQADPEVHDTRNPNFAIINFTKKTILIGGTAYTGEIKKGIFSVLNFVLPHEHNVLSMHCSANVGDDGDTAIFFGLSGTGKTTLSNDPERGLIGDDEHGWTGDKIFNFEGGCYAKVIDLSPRNEPMIYNAIKFGSLLENVRFFENSRSVNYEDDSVTQNTRVAYPLTYVDNAIDSSVGSSPQNLFFLTCDAFGVLPPISKLTTGQAMYQFISGYTAKVAGTEAGITEPQLTFSACFGAPFLPLHPAQYAEMLGEKLRNNDVNVWLINTGWTGGPYGVGKRINLPYTRAMISAALKGRLRDVEYEEQPIFGLYMPTSCPDVPSEILNPRNTWDDKQAFDQKANELADAFNKNFEKYADQANEEILNAAPQTSAKV